ncbi:hypothetical protein HXX76_009130 [Chlamydomonas incerta]|uniref:Protein kinase domain-containing protein n=1 Tax=Chlamydomonas incerta TaxID=51695 RepID=A0A835SUS4_CHLIN|nr:hypothetical protein HXX76_009130 [Chlamydomonas incerta]|eukprot:KAG2432211.1 hypothetical protein HXX76_009130 [Chlamydomonas incerta]
MPVDSPGNARAAIMEAATAEAPPHANLVRVLRFIELDTVRPPTVAVVMERLQGVSLDVRLSAADPAPFNFQQPRWARLDVGRCFKIALGVASGLAHLHSQGISHNDVKPQNMMWDEASGSLKLFDLGLAFRGAPTPSVRVPEPIHYLDPAALRREQPLGVFSDAWALGVLIAELLQGPCSGRPFTHAMEGVGPYAGWEAVARRAAAVRGEVRLRLQAGGGAAAGGWGAPGSALHRMATAAVALLEPDGLRPTPADVATYLRTGAGLPEATPQGFARAQQEVQQRESTLLDRDSAARLLPLLQDYVVGLLQPRRPQQQQAPEPAGEQQQQPQQQQRRRQGEAEPGATPPITLPPTTVAADATTAAAAVGGHFLREARKAHEAGLRQYLRDKEIVRAFRNTTPGARTPEMEEEALAALARLGFTTQLALGCGAAGVASAACAGACVGGASGVMMERLLQQWELSSAASEAGGAVASAVSGAAAGGMVGVTAGVGLEAAIRYVTGAAASASEAVGLSAAALPLAPLAVGCAVAGGASGVASWRAVRKPGREDRVRE